MLECSSHIPSPGITWSLTFLTNRRWPRLRAFVAPGRNFIWRPLKIRPRSMNRPRLVFEYSDRLPRKRMCCSTDPSSLRASAGFFSSPSQAAARVA